MEDIEIHYHEIHEKTLTAYFRNKNDNSYWGLYKETYYGKGGYELTDFKITILQKDDEIEQFNFSPNSETAKMVQEYINEPINETTKKVYEDRLSTIFHLDINELYERIYELFHLIQRAKELKWFS